MFWNCWKYHKEEIRKHFWSASDSVNTGNMLFYLSEILSVMWMNEPIKNPIYKENSQKIQIYTKMLIQILVNITTLSSIFTYNHNCISINKH